MALTPPNNNTGFVENDSPNRPVPWDNVLATNNQVIDRSDMPSYGTVEYKGYYKAEATGIHKFNLTGASAAITGYSWISSAPANSDHIKRNNRGARLVFNKSFAIHIPVKPIFKNILDGSGVVFPGYGYWPKSGYGNNVAFNNIYSGAATPSTDCSHTQVVHQYLVPGDARIYGDKFPKFEGKQAGPGWQAPEDPNFSAPCWPSKYSRPLVAVDNNLIPDLVDNFAVPTTQGRVTQISLDNGYIAGGDDNFARFKTVDIQGEHTYIWPIGLPEASISPPVGYEWNKIKEPQRIQIRFAVMFQQETQDYTFEWKSRDGLKMWYRFSQPNDNRYFQKFPTTSGNNPCNLTAEPTGNNGWLPGGKFDGFTGKLKIKQNTWMIFHGHGVGEPTEDTHGFSIVIKNSNGDIVFDSTDLLDRGDKIGIDECGYNALLKDASRIPGNRVTEFYNNDGWNGIDNDIFKADSVVGDNNERDPSTTRQYLWSNAITRTGRNGNSISGDVFLRQGDYYFIRTIVSSNAENGGFTFKVTTPIGEFKSVMFSGNSNPGSDTSVGGSFGGTGIDKDKLCDSILFRDGKVAVSDNTNFAVVDRLGVVLNLNSLGLSSGDIGKEGQDEVVKEKEESGSVILKFKNNTLYPDTTITLDELVRNGGEDIAKDEKKSWIVNNEYIKQINNDPPETMQYSDFVGAINSQAVIRWGSGGNYEYIYHAVSTIIESICTGKEIIKTDTSGVNSALGGGSSNANDMGAPTSIEINVTNISGGAGLITSVSLNECKHPKDYPALTNEYTKNKSNYLNSDSSYYDSIVIEKDATLYYNGPDKSTPNGDKYSLFRSQINKSIRFKPGKVTSIPFTVPDYYEPDWINQKDAIRYNSFSLDINEATIIGDVTPGSEPQLLVWWSIYAGGPALGESFIIVGAGGTEVVATFSSLLLNKNSDTNIVGYLGNIYGTRWVNFATVDRDLSSPTSIKDLEIGSTAFMNRLSNFGLEIDGRSENNSLALSMTIPVPDCSKSDTVSSNSIPLTQDTMRSLPNMRPYIGDNWDGTIPSHVEIATNSGYKWGYAAGSQPYPAGMGPGNESPRLSGNAVFFPQPTNGKILSYEWASTNEKIVPYSSYTWVWSPSGGQSVLNSCSPSLTVVRWFSATPGGRPLLNINGQRRIFNIGDAGGDRNFRMQQLYDVNDSQIENYYTIPVITKKYFLNAACIEYSLFATLEAQGRAPTASEVREFNPLACGSDNSYSYIVGGPRGEILDFDTWLKENT